jgi:hypothetical protein
MMDNTVLVALITGIISVITTLITVWLPIRQKNKELKSQNLELLKKVEHLASTGVAIGYYFNFIEMVYKIIDESDTIKLEVYDSNKSITEIKEFNSNKVRLEIIIPRSLEGSSFVAAAGIRDQYQKGDILRVGTKRNFGINYSIQDEATLVIMDMPGPLSAVEKFLRQLPDFRDYIDPETGRVIVKNNNELFRKRQSEEIENFINTIKILIEDNRYAVNKVTFRQLT